MNEELLKIIGYIMRSTYRWKCIKAIGDDVKTPTNIAKDSDMRIFHVSNILNELKKINLVECINEEKRKGRLYRLTDKGLQVKKIMEGL